MKKNICTVIAALLAATLMPTLANAAPYASYPYSYYDFEENAENDVNWANAEYKASNDGYAGSKGSLEITLNGDGQMISTPVSLTSGETYNITCYIKPKDDVNVNYINFIFWFKQKMNDGTAGKNEGFSTARVNNVYFKGGKWTKVTTQYTYTGQVNINGKMEDAVNEGRVSIRFGGGTLKELNDSSEFIYRIDDFSIEPTFKESTIKEPFKEVNLINNGDFSKELGSEWIPLNSEIEISDDIPTKDCVAKKSVHVTQTVRAGKVYQNISIKPNTKYKLTFWAKGNNSGNAVPAFEWDEGSEKQYEYLNESNIPFEDEWKKYTLLYTTGSNISKDVRFYIYSKKLQKTDFYLTEINLTEWPFDTTEIEDPDKVTTPEIRDIEVDGYLIKDDSIKINAEYLGPNQQTGLVQLFKQADDGGWASIKTAEFNGDDFVYTFKESDIGQKIKVRIVPMDVNGNVGGYREKELGTVFNVFEVQSDFTSKITDNIISAQTTITNWSEQDRNIVCMLLLFDENNACIASEYKSVFAKFGKNNAIGLSVQNTGNCDKAKLFIWEGESDINTTMIPIVNCVTLAE